jgi:hypothetical protein
LQSLADKNPKYIIPPKQACNHLGANANPEATIPVKQAYNHFVANKNPKSTIPPKPACNHFGANANPVATIPMEQSFAITNQQCHKTVRKSECIKGIQSSLVSGNFVIIGEHAHQAAC